MPYAGEISALVTAVFWTGSAITFSMATSRVGSIYVNVTRLIAAALMLFAAIFVFPGFTQITFTQIVFLTISGWIGFIFGDTFLFKSFESLSVRISMLIMALSPAFTAFFAYCFLGETLSWFGIVGIGVTLFGIALVVLEHKDESSHHLPLSFAGIVYALLGAVGQAGGLIFARKAFDLGAINGVHATFIRVLASTVVIIPMNYFAGRISHPVKIFQKDKKAFGFTILGAFFGPFVGVSFSLIAISLTNVAVAATLMATVPIFILPLSHFLFDEKISFRAIAGAVIAVGGVAILFLR